MNALHLLAALTAAPEKSPDLKPARGTIPPTLWEMHGWALTFLAAIFLVLFVSIIHRLRQPKPVILPTLADLARCELSALRGVDAALVNTGAASTARWAETKKLSNLTEMGSAVPLFWSDK